MALSGRKLTEAQQNVYIVLKRMQKLVVEDHDMALDLGNNIEAMLDELHGDDCFGTEGQMDPRGDFRNGEFTVFSPERRDD